MFMSKDINIIKNWYNMRKVEAFCIRFGYSQEYIEALIGIHAIHLNDKNLNKDEILESILISSIKDHKNILKNYGQENNRKLLDVFSKLSQDKNFVDKIYDTYKNQIKEKIKLF